MTLLQSPLEPNDAAPEPTETETSAPEPKAAELTVPEPVVPEPTISLTVTYNPYDGSDEERRLKLLLQYCSRH